MLQMTKHIIRAQHYGGLPQQGPAGLAGQGPDMIDLHGAISKAE